LQLFESLNVRRFMISQELWSEIIVSLLTIIFISVIVVLIFVVIYPIEKRKGNLRIGEIIKNLLKKLV
jgi:hypothetical protein